MFKCLLNELCQKHGMGSPEYSFIKDGEDHNPHFKASVVVNGITFSSVNKLKSSKAAYNDVAEIAFDHYKNQSQKEVANVMQKMEKLKVNAISSCSSGALSESGDFCMTISPEEKLAQNSSTTPDHSGSNKSTDSYLLCKKVRVYTSIPNTVLPEGSVVLTLGGGKWTIVSLE